MDVVEFTIPGRAVPWARPVDITTKQGQRRRLTSQAHREAMERVKGLAHQAWGRRAPFTGPVRLEVLAVYAIPTGWTPARRARAMEGLEWHPARPDWDNLGKLISDSLNAIAFLDDAQICDGRVAKRYGSPERTVVRVTALEPQDPVGVSESRGCASPRRGPQNERRAGTHAPTRPLNT